MTISRQTKSRTIFIRLWQRFCHRVVKTFYRKFEVSGNQAMPDDRGVILCANHVNALVDPILIQASTKRVIRPLARSGLFSNPLLKPILALVGAVPIYRRGDNDSETGRNIDSFSQCYELLAQNETLIIFPEGQSHSDPHLHDLKTGAARMAIGAQSQNKRAPIVVPVGLTFTHKGKFRSNVLVHYGDSIDLDLPDDIHPREAVRLLTQRIADGLEAVTLNADSWEDIDLVGRLERFFALRHGKYRSRDLSKRFRALQRLIEGQKLLKQHEPSRVRALISHLRAFERLCQCCGVKDYHLTVEYRPLLVVIYIVRTLAIILFALPLAVWGVINSFIPFYLTRHLSRRIAHGTDQYDTTKILLGLIFFSIFWIAQTILIYNLFGLKWAIVYFISLLIGASVSLTMRGESRRIRENLKVFFLFARRRRLRDYLEAKRHELEVELAKLVRIAKRL